MSVILCLFFLAASTSGAILAPQQLEHFFDAVLEEGRHLVTVSTKIPDNELSTGIPFLDVSAKWEGTAIRGPTNVERKGSTAGVQTAEQAHAEAMVSLGHLNVDVTKVSVKFFGYSFSSEVHFSILDAEAPVTIDVFRNNLATCQVSVNMLAPTGSYVVHFGSHGAPAFVSAILDYGISFLVQLIPFDSSFIVDRYFLPYFTSRINRELTIAARRIAC
nr:uncharacterized protein LOC106686307 [Halyomorpha halys]